MNTLPEISENEINKAKNDIWDFLFLFIDKYHEMMTNKPDEDMAQNFNNSQHTLMAFNFLYGQVCNGGFLQLIQNGYGNYVFDSPFVEDIRIWGAEKIADIVEDAKVIYEKNREELEKEITIEEFSAMYKEFTEFEPLDDRFYEVMDIEIKKIKDWVENHLSDFAVIKK